MRKLPDGSILIKDPRPFHAGLHKGSSDLIGWKPVVVTESMVGETVALFVSVEVKTATGRVTTEQKQWIDVINTAGGIAGVARSDHDAVKLIRGE